MVAITLQIMVNAPTHEIRHRNFDGAIDPEQTAARYRNGDIIAVHNTANSATFIAGAWRWNDVISAPRSVFVHISNLPNNLAPKARRRLTGSMRAGSDLLRRKQYRLPPSALPVPVQDALRDDREVTMTWAQAKTVIRKKIINVVLDPSQDDETTSIVDGDLL